MTSLIREIIIDAEPDEAWDALRDWYQLHERLVPGFVVDAVPQGRDRVVTFFNGSRVQELFVGADDEARRLSWAVTDGSLGLTHYNASAQAFRHEQSGQTRFVWTADLLPDAVAPAVAQLIEQGLAVIKSTLEKGSLSS
ncbi:polyketide cyclase/dehydrase/lipid transport protein [Mumia flava]|uniref:Polyketide cyclase/dehydrase/lipid transport protein n=1 Tax=Mumia flava TaxID=1348852 RepID=A0A0B2B7B5_9ACTN|nr:SRPBCC family protein [Mumia flava]PJJ57701.1 polyketide cyclase/dehydrase/lipid transport protein [Mumia flava]